MRLKLQPGESLLLKTTRVTLGIHHNFPPTFMDEVKVNICLINAGGSISRNSDYISNHCPATPSRNVLLKPLGQGSMVKLALDKIPADVHKIAFSLAISGDHGNTLSQLSRLKVIVDGIASWAPLVKSPEDKAMMIIDICREDDGWKLFALG